MADTPSRTRHICRNLVWMVFVLTVSWAANVKAVEPATRGKPLNVVLITVDDRHCDSVGVYGCPISGITRHIDRLASQGLRFEHGHVTIAICQPTREV